MNRVRPILVCGLLLSMGAAGQTVRRTADGKPDLNGIWQALNSAAWDIQDHSGQLGMPPGLGVVEGNAIPYQPWAAAKKKENFANRAAADPTEASCFLPGVPRATYMPFPFQIIQGNKKIVIAYEFASASRIIPLEKVDAAPTESYMGWSAGRWEGDTLVVDVTGLNDKTWFDRAGNFHSEALHVVERYTPASREMLLYEATLDDPKVFTRPWKISFPLYRRVDKNAQFLEFKCVPFAEELLYGHLRKEASK